MPYIVLIDGLGELDQRTASLLENGIKLAIETNISSITDKTWIVKAIHTAAARDTRMMSSNTEDAGEVMACIASYRTLYHSQEEMEQIVLLIGDVIERALREGKIKDSDNLGIQTIRITTVSFDPSHDGCDVRKYRHTN